MKKQDKEFLDGLEAVFKENQADLTEAMETLEKRPNDDGMLFSKDFRDHMAPFGDKNPLEMLKDKNFWRHLAKYAGISDEEFENIVNAKK